MKSTHRPRYLLLIVALLMAAPASAQRDIEPDADAESLERASDALRDLISSVWTPRSLYTDSPQVRAAFRDTIVEARKATVRVRVGGQNRSLGGVVGPDGWVVTKASRLTKKTKKSSGKEITVRLEDGRELDARIVGVDRDYDLAMLKVDATDLPTLDLGSAEENAGVEPGDWVATVGTSRDPIAVGVVSVQARKIAHRSGILGIRLAEGASDGKGARIVRVYEKTGAEDAGLMANDIVNRINDQPIRGRVELIETVRRYSPGDTIDVGLLRDGKPMTVKATLTGRNKVKIAGMRMSRSEYQNSLGGSLSERRFGFPKALQHDTALAAGDCGGPLVDLDGRVIGFNLARSGRTESYAVPTAELPQRLFALMSGSRPPE